MTLLDWLIGGGCVGAMIAAFGMYVASVVLRERRGPEARIVTLGTSHPLFTSAFTLIAVIGIGLLMLRLGALS